MNVKDYMDRALMLGINSGFIDEAKSISFKDGKATLDFTRFVECYDLKGDIEIPEGITKVYISFTTLEFDRLDDITSFIFPSTLTFFGDKDREAYGSICVYKGNSWYNDCFKDIVLDFRKCKHLTEVSQVSFRDAYIKGIYLPETVAHIKEMGFCEAHIGTFYGKGLCKYSKSAFLKAEIDSFKVSGRVHATMNSFVFKKRIKELIFTDIVYMEGLCFGNIEAIYLPYSRSYLSDYLLSILSDVSKSIKAHKTDIGWCMRETRQISSRVDSVTHMLYTSIMSKLIDYLAGNIADFDFIDEVSNLVYYGEDSMITFYFYNKDCGIEGIKDRKYEYVGEEEITVYVER